MKRITIAVLFFSFFIQLQVFGYELPKSVDIGLESLGSKGEFTINTTRIELDGDLYESSDGFTVKADGTGGIILTDGQKELDRFSQKTPIFYSADGGYIAPSGKEYRGGIQFVSNGTNGLRAINKVPVEEYLYSVVPAEMPSQWESEALKAQAVAARTYMAKKLGVHKEKGYDLCDSVHCQAYQGVSRETPSTTQAVEETYGEIMTYNDAPIEALYFSSSGGATDNSENVYTNAVPYLKGVEDTYEDSPSWEKSLTTSELQKCLANAGADIGQITGMTVTKTTKLGRVQEITIQGTEGEKILTKENTRTFFSPAIGSLPSRMFEILRNGEDQIATTKEEYTVLSSSEQFLLQEGNSSGTKIDVSEAATAPVEGKVISRLEEKIVYSGSGTGDFLIVGKGNGHGVGMSQYGANGMAKNGFTYDEILCHYYTDIVIEESE
ncbi:MAG: SpoIID/LytB domain-containing protein [Clostridiales bacterium]|nr:SpoIID/LytB domain-containing protein [Clostridiales bacterium]